ncbi:efflux RND transporter periplasmic adaptor subunit [Prolixibacteraceae bacterium Z1-6]|uniref:Efflux RND transporter periplasmic adaptor subunit n=1 Tax=Draconibacterium aestuarii TaxID=2998507 RepID=A0A9X3J7A4_9BACT|nr:efflux RND transporter periplasmic adaptor subunit [Prolixibacteraceae bacterium Z1-6]
MGDKNRLFIIIIIAVFALSSAAFYFYSKYNVPSTLKAGSFQTETIERGTVISSIKASGVVESESEVLILSPARSIIKKVLVEPGSWVGKGELILQLDKENVAKEIEQISDQLEMKRNSLEKTQLNAQSTRLDLGYNEEVKKLRITSLKSTLADQQQLLEVGGISPARIEKTKQEIVLAEKDLETLVEKNSIRLKQLAADEKGLILQIKAQGKDLDEKQNLLKKLDIKAPSAGIILAVTGNEGSRVDADKTLVRMSDLTSFKVIGSIDEKFAKQLKTGNRVFVKIDNEDLPGRVGNITPMVENQKVQFTVHLQDKSHPKLISNQSVEVHIINSDKENVLRIKKIPAFESGNQQQVFVIKGNEAIKTNIILGTIGNDYCEIVSGITEGEKVIIDDLNFRGLDRIEIEN